MKLAIFSDIHGNYDAFERVLADMTSRGVDRLVCLGDCVGYGPEPERVIAEVMRRRIDTVIGNHELAIIEPRQLAWFNPVAGLSLQLTQKMLSADALNFIHGLPRSRVIAGARFVHGYPPDSASTYLFQKSRQDHRKTFAMIAESICFVGHTHELAIIRFDGDRVQHDPLACGLRELHPDHHYIINVGSVGQPRDGNNNAKYVIWESRANWIDVRFVPYDIAGVVAKIRAAGLPESLGRRLW